MNRYAVGKNYLEIQKDFKLMLKDGILPGTYYAYTDTKDELAPRIFENAGLKVHVVEKFEHNENDSCIVVLCKIRKGFEASTKFIECMETLYRNQLLAGNDYHTMCMLFHRSSNTVETHPDIVTEFPELKGGS